MFGRVRGRKRRTGNPKIEKKNEEEGGRDIFVWRSTRDQWLRRNAREMEKRCGNPHGWGGGGAVTVPPTGG